MTPLFKRNDKTTIAELEEYYANQRKRRSGMAWLMAFLSLLITVAIIIGLFFGGRWLYRTVFDKDNGENDTTSTTGETEDVDLPNFDSEELGSDRGVSFEEGSSNDQDDLVVSDESSDSQSDNNTDGTVSDEAASTTDSNADRLATGGDSGNGSESDENSDVASSSTDEIPNTGAGETLLFALIAVVVFGYLASRKFYQSK